MGGLSRRLNHVGEVTMVKTKKLKDEAVVALDSPEPEAIILKSVEAAEPADLISDDAVVQPEESAKTETVAKAGKRSAKAIAEETALAEKEERKAAGDTAAQGDEESITKKGPKPTTRPRVERRGKNYRKVVTLIEPGKLHALKDAVELTTKTATTKFDSSVEVHVRLGVDPRQADQNIRATVSLPNGTGRAVKVAVFAPADQHSAAKTAGADIVGEDDFLAQLDKETINFDILIATPQFMPRLGKYARMLGPRGLMPNPKSGTVTTNIAGAVKEAKAGRVEYRVDKQSIVHLAVGKVSFGADKLEENIKAFMDSLNSVKPSSLKSSYVQALSLTTTMGPGIKVDLKTL